MVLKCFRRISQRFELSTMKEPSLQTDTWWLTYFNLVNYSIAVNINVIICIMLSVTLCWNTKKSDSCDYTNILGSVWSSEQGVKNKLQNVYFSFVGLPGTSSLLHCTRPDCNFDSALTDRQNLQVVLICSNETTGRWERNPCSPEPSCGVWLDQSGGLY